MIVQADILKWTETYDGELFHAAFMDAPYEQSFMGREWDARGVAFDPETWKAIARHLYPGAWLFVFAGTINDDLISLAMREAGLRKHHKALAWGFGSGFPKATRISDKIDRRAGVARRVVGTRKHQPKFDAKGFEYRKKDNGYNSKDRATFDVTAPATDEAQAWDGHRYGQQCIKPAVETILIFQKPYTKRGAISDMLATGSGGLWIDGGRIPMAADDQKGEFGPHKPEHLEQPTTRNIYNGAYRRSEADQSTGRWPANLLLSHLPECNGSCAPECPVQRLGEQRGEGSSKASQRGAVKIFSDDYKLVEGWQGDSTERGHDDSGTAARFFFQADYVLDRLEESDPIIYCAKSSRAEREAGLDPRTRAMMESWDEEFGETTVDDGRQTPIDNAYLRGETKRRNPHPCLKPLSLTRYLATLLLPPALYAPRRLLVPFAGVGSEYIGALLAGWEEIVGVELDDEGLYIPVANARIDYWKQRRAELADPSKPITIKAAPDVPQGQLDMFAA